jgi:EAL domain-containing protein (putative c-di-GMP-specific phosphodiesterase class I)
MAGKTDATVNAKAGAGAPSLLQLLSFVFASADMVMEVDAGTGQVAYATGAAVRLLGRTAESLVGQAWRELIEPADVELIEAALECIAVGERRGPFRVGLASSFGVQPAEVSLFQAPQRKGRVAIALSLSQPGFTAVRVDADGLTSREDFEAAAAQLAHEAERSGVSLQVDLLEFAGLAVSLSGMDVAGADEARRKLAAMMRAASYGGFPPAALSEERFAVLSSGGSDGEALTRRVREVAGDGVTLSVGELALDPASPAESLRAIRYAIDRCIEEGPQAASKSFEAALRQTVTESNRFKDLLKSGRFELVYQPVVDLKDRTLHHYEALTRFEGGGGPAALIKLAEELGLVVEFDLAIVKGVVEVLREAPVEIRVAANISAFSLQAEGFVDAVLTLTALTPKVRPRLLLELTESHKLTELEAANALIQKLRRAGHIVCLDDFGAGAASLDYLRRLETDVVKFDGHLVQSIAARPRDAILLRRLAELCRELSIVTVGEMIESEEAAGLAADMGIELGQGWLFGRPVPRPVPLTRPPPPVAARRQGVTETWA